MRRSRGETFLQRRRAQEQAEAAGSQVRGRAQRARPRRRSQRTMAQKMMLVATAVLGILLVGSFVLPYLFPGR